MSNSKRLLRKLIAGGCGATYLAVVATPLYTGDPWGEYRLAGLFVIIYIGIYYYLTLVE